MLNLISGYPQQQRFLGSNDVFTDIVFLHLFISENRHICNSMAVQFIHFKNLSFSLFNNKDVRWLFFSTIQHTQLYILVNWKLQHSKQKKQKTRDRNWGPSMTWTQNLWSTNVISRHIVLMRTQTLFIYKSCPRARFSDFFMLHTTKCKAMHFE